jgi:hypothetical protein
MSDGTQDARRLPDFFVVGHPKSGTTALYEMLRAHPQIFMPERKEPRYFADDLPSRYRPWIEGAEAETYDDYLALFAPARPDQLVGEASTAYIWSLTAARRIAEARPDARIVAVFREPATYLRSLHLQLLEIGTEKEPSLRRAIELEGVRREGHELPDAVARWPAVLMYTEHVRYREQLRRFEQAFPREQLLTLVYDDFRSDNEGTVRAVQRFLGVDDTLPLEQREANPSVQLRSVRMDETLTSVVVGRSRLARTMRGAVTLVTPPNMRMRAYRAMRRRMLFSAPPPPDEPLMLELRARFKPEVEAFGEHLGRDLVRLWGYESL